MGLRIDSQPALLGMNIKYPLVELSSYPTKITLHPGKDVVKIERDYGQIIVNSDPVREAIGLFGQQTLAKKTVADAQAAVLAGIRRRAEEGILLTEMYEDGCEVAKLAAKVVQHKQCQLEVKATPPAEVTYEPGFLEIEVQIEEDQFDVSLGSFEVNVEWANIEVYIRQKDYLKMSWTGNLLDIFG